MTRIHPAVWIVAALVFVAYFGWALGERIERDNRRAVVCGEMGGYIEKGTSLCRDRKTEDVLATWKELEGR